METMFCNIMCFSTLFCSSYLTFLTVTTQNIVVITVSAYEPEGVSKMFIVVVI